MTDAMSRCPMTSTVVDAAKGCPVIGRDGFDPFGDDYLADPPSSLDWSRDEAPVFYSEELGYWVITRYEDVKAVFRDNITFSPANALEKLTPAPQEAAEVLESYGYAMNRTLVNEDEPAHMARRRALQDPFAPAELAHHEDMVRRLVREHVDRFIERGRADLVDEMLYDVPLTVALYFLGIPEEDMDKLREYSVSHTLNTWGRPRPDQQVAIADSVGRFWEYAGKVLDKLRKDPSGHGWMPYSIRLQQQMPHVVTDSYLHSMMMAGLVAAHETTAHAAANGIKLLLENRDAWETLCADPDLIPGAVDECLRHSGSVAAWRRVATRDTEVAGVPIPEGAKLLIVNSSANHDERHFEYPDVLDIQRDNADDHLTFGYGAHRCLGKNLARMELQIFLQELTTRLPHLELVPDQEFTYLPNTSFRGPEHLWVRWDPTANPETERPELLDGRGPVEIGTVVDRRREVVLKDVTPVSRDVVELTLVAPDGTALPGWTAGAHVDIALGDLSRQYSLCGPHDGTYRVAVRREGDGRGGSRYVHDVLRPGDRLRIKGPRNRFPLDFTAYEHVLVAGGIGVTPVLAMADTLKERGLTYAIHYAGRDSESMAYVERLRADHGGSLQLHPSSAGTRMDLDALFAEPRDGVRIYGCGPDRLLEGLERATCHWPEGSLLVEHFTAAESVLDPEVEHEFDVELLQSGRTITVPRDRTVLDALRDAQVEVDSDCEEGICGSCEVAVLAGEVDHRDRVLSAEERRSNTRMMACCSRADGPRLILNL